MQHFSPNRLELPNGFRIVTIDLPGRRSLTNFLALRSGSRYEEGGNNGVAHFLEHVVFKGTDKFPSNDVLAQAIEGVGGTLNAWTDFDHTAYWNIVPGFEWRVGLEMPLELAFRPRVRDEDIERERGVIIEEIRMLQDDPARYVYDLATTQIFAGNALARPIIGNEATIKAMTPAQFQAYRDRFYTPSQAVFVVVGDLEGKDIVGTLKAAVSSLEPKPVTLPTRLESQSPRSVNLLTKSTDQTHFIIGTAHPSLGLDNTKERYASSVLNTVLGQGMSSRLFLEVREKQALAYSINSSLGTLEDAGTLVIYGGVNTAKTAQALKATSRELQRLQSEKVPRDELERAKAQIIGGNDIKADSGLSLATWYGTDWLLGRWETHDEVAAGVNAVSAADVQALAAELFQPEHLTLAMIGPHESADTFAEILTKQ
jgi:predicted Zn-dependent peptidase